MIHIPAIVAVFAIIVLTHKPVTAQHLLALLVVVVVAIVTSVWEYRSR